jgi:hypothetical protein
MNNERTEFEPRDLSRVVADARRHACYTRLHHLFEGSP